ncbi:hypothetical protein M0G43_12705 [Subsaxibacter sp. CAU 1640]|uniref:hypothetical protein n=1 Tax=Subsaxibacter sp. CAU 1640 TaxID=2933271 RepID=UPI002004554B|nr:hypothetical protein [Subsaxibacter sp. CAU 1640]MCK7591439.1 hypothetical protein [Subsaxibacter sp. CAU 1640]
MKETFQIRENGFDDIKKAALIKIIPLVMIAVGAGFAISYFSINGQTNSISALPFAIPVIIGAVALGLYKGINRQKSLFESYLLTINDKEIIREQLNTQTIVIPKDQIKSIIRNPNGTITILGNSTAEIIGIPCQIDHREKLQQLLSQIIPITTVHKKPLIEKYIWLLSLLVMGLFATVYISTHKLVVGVTGTLLILILGYSFYEVCRSKNIDKKTKNGMWWIILILFAVIGNMYFKLTGKI